MSELKKKIKPGLIELDPVEPVIIVHITNLLLDPNQLGEDGQPLVVQKTQEQKRIKLKTFRATSTISKFAQAVVENCPFIHASKEPQIQQLLEQLKQRMLASERADSPIQKPPPTVDTAEDSDEEAKLVNDVPRQTRPKSAARTRTGSVSNTTNVRQPPAPQQSESPKNSTPQHRLSQSSAANSSLTMSVNGSFAANTSINVKESNMLSNMRSSQTRSSLSQQPEEDEEAQPVSKKNSKSQSRKSFDHEDERKEDDDGEERVLKKKKKKDKDAIGDGVEKKKKKKKSLDASLREPERERSNSFSEPESPREEAYMNQLDTYSEELYEEDMKHKVHGTKMILKLVQNPVNLEHFIDNETMLGALARVLQEDHKKSTKLVTNILEIFFCFSSFSQLHGILLNNKIGDATMKIVDLEIKRYEMRMEKQDNDGLARYLASQERLLFVCFYILLNLSEDTAIEYKMKQRHIVKHLVRMLNRTNRDRKFLDELLLLIVTFLKKLSIFEENKTEMVSYQILSKLLNFLDTTNEDLLEAVLRLVFNLSFDAQQRAELVSRAMIPRFVNILQRQLCRPVTIRLLYNISMDHQHRHVLDQMLQPAIPMLVQWIIRSPNKYVDRELLALAINLATTPTNIELMCAQDGLHHMIKRVHQTFDPLLMKLIRTISEQTGPTQHIFKKYLHELVGMALKSQNHDFLVEVLAVLANISLPDVLYSELLIKHGLLDFLVKHLVPGFADDDIVLECIMIVGTMASDPKSAPILANARFIRILYELLTEKIEDVEIVTQTVYALFKMLLHKETREAIALHPNLSNSLLDLVVDPAPEVRHFANACLDMIMDHDMEWREKIRGKRFEAFNREWLALAAKGNMGTGYPGLESPTSSNFGGGKSPGGYGDYYPGGQYGDAESPYSGLGSSEHRHYMNQLDDSMDG